MLLRNSRGETSGPMDIRTLPVPSGPALNNGRTQSTETENRGAARQTGSPGKSLEKREDMQRSVSMSQWMMHEETPILCQGPAGSRFLYGEGV